MGSGTFVNRDSRVRSTSANVFSASNSRLEFIRSRSDRTSVRTRSRIKSLTISRRAGERRSCMIRSDACSVRSSVPRSSRRLLIRFDATDVGRSRARWVSVSSASIFVRYSSIFRRARSAASRAIRPGPMSSNDDSLRLIAFARASCCRTCCWIRSSSNAAEISKSVAC